MIAQLVEQWTENPCVAGSTPARTTKFKPSQFFEKAFCFVKGMFTKSYLQLLFSIAGSSEVSEPPRIKTQNLLNK